VLYEAHTAHVGGKIEDVPRLAGCQAARFLHRQIQHAVINIVESLIPPFERLDVYGPKPTVATASKLRHEVAAYEASRTGYQRQMVWVQVTHLGNRLLLMGVKSQSDTTDRLMMLATTAD
jgi:hypothetical protein